MLTETLMLYSCCWWITNKVAYEYTVDSRLLYSQYKKSTPPPHGKIVKHWPVRGEKERWGPLTRVQYDSHAVMYMHLNCLNHVLHHSDVVFKLRSFVFLSRQGWGGGAGEAEAEGGEAQDTLCIGLQTVQNSKPPGEKYFAHCSFKVGINSDIHPKPEQISKI